MQGQSWKTTGTATIVRHTLLWSIPGFHFGIIFITRRVSLSSKKYLDAVQVPAERKEELQKYAQRMMKRKY